MSACTRSDPAGSAEPAGPAGDPGHPGHPAHPISRGPLGPNPKPVAAGGAAAARAQAGHGAAGRHDLRVLRLPPALHVQRWTLPAGLAHAILLQRGSGQLAHEQGELLLRAPGVAWQPGGRACSLRVEPGSSALVVGVSGALLAAALGERPTMAALRQLSLRRCLVGAGAPALQEELVRSLWAIEAESRRDGDDAPSQPYLVAHLTLLLVLLGRLCGGEGEDPSPSAGAPVRLQRFRQLVEAQFRSHWPLTRYAAELGLSADRLHDLCRRHLGRSPLALVHQRVLREACSLLAGTDLPVERVALELGFTGSSAFSRFFRRGLRHSPSAWRAAVRAQAAAGPAAAAPNYADWP